MPCKIDFFLAPMLQRCTVLKSSKAYLLHLIDRLTRHGPQNHIWKTNANIIFTSLQHLDTFCPLCLKDGNVDNQKRKLLTPSMNLQGFSKFSRFFYLDLLLIGHLGFRGLLHVIYQPSIDIKQTKQNDYTRDFDVLFVKKEPIRQWKVKNYVKGNQGYKITIKGISNCKY